MKKGRMVVPLVVSTPPPEFGELLEDPAFLAEDGARKDVSYVPGFSDMRRQRDQEILEVTQGARRPAEVSTLQVNLRWAKAQNRLGEPDSRKVVAHGARGYRAVTKDDVGQPWLLKLPPGAEVGADGTIRQHDVQLMVTDAKTAARHELQKQFKTEKAISGAKRTLADKKDAFVDQEIGTRPRNTIYPDDEA